MDIHSAYQILYTTALIVLAVLIAVTLVRAVKGPRITDRILSINMIGTMVICSIAILSRLLEEAYLIDVAILYAMVSFVTVLVFSMIYIPAHPGRSPFFHSREKKTGNPGKEEKDL